MRLTGVLGFVSALAIAAVSAPQAASQQSPTPPAAVTAAPAAVFNQYCVTCHHPRLKTAGLVIDPSDLAQTGAHAEVWEKV